MYKGLALVCSTQSAHKQAGAAPRRAVSNLTHVRSLGSNVARQHAPMLPHIPGPFLFALQKLVQQQAPCQPHRRPGWSLGQADGLLRQPVAMALLPTAHLRTSTEQ